MSERRSFVLAATDDGPLIVNRMDRARNAAGDVYDVGHQLLETGVFDRAERDLGLRILRARRQHFGDGVVCLDAGANIGAFTVPWAREMEGWGRIVSVEAQERLYYALAGNVALNNLFNVRVVHAALGEDIGQVMMPVPDYRECASFGSLMLRGEQTDLGQEVTERAEVRMVTVDSLMFPRLDFLKLDVEGMECDVLAGATTTLRLCRPIVLAEQIKTDRDKMRKLLEFWGYRTFSLDLAMLAIHQSDPTLKTIRVVS